MQKISKKVMSLLLALVMVISLLPPVTGVAWADETTASTELSGTEVIDAGGVYTVGEDATGIITISTIEPVTISGKGVTIDENGNITSAAYKNLKVKYTVSGAELTLRDMFLEDRADTSPLVDLQGTDNKLFIEGTVVMDKYGSGQGTYANIHVDPDTELTIGGSGTLYLYKQSGGAGIGGNKNEMNGDITFAMTGAAFIKGTKQGAVIGAGTGAKGSGAPGKVTFLSGDYNLISNSRGAVIGGSAGSDGASEGTAVYVKGGAVNINTDYSGSSVGGGGYDSGNDASGGTVYITGGSLRTYVDKNATKNLNGKYYKDLPLIEGVNNVSMTALRKNADGEDVYLCVVDTKDIEADVNGSYTVTVDSEPYYIGGLHEYGFIQEGLDKGEQLQLSSTPSNWYKNGETRLFLYLTGKAHQIDVNGTVTLVGFNSDAIGTIDECNGNAFSVLNPSLTLSDEEIRLSKVGDTQHLTATTKDTTDPVVWSSSDEKVVTVDESGKLTAVGTGRATVIAKCGTLAAECSVLVGARTIAIRPNQSDADIVLSSGIVYTCVEDTYVGTLAAADEAAELPAGVAYDLFYGRNYTATITKDGFYASQFSFSVTESGKVVEVNSQKLNNNLKSYVKNDSNIVIPMTAFAPSQNAGAWDGKTLDVSWYSESAAEMSISTPAQLAGMAAIVNGIYNAEITTILDDADGDGTVEAYTPSAYAALQNRKIIAAVSSGDASGPNGNNLVTTNDYWYGVKADGFTPADFKGQTVNITADLDMGGYQDGDGNWTGARYMTIGGQSVMQYIDYGARISDGLAHLGSSFNGTLDGHGHILKNVYCDRYASGSNFGDSQSVGIVGRLGIHDNDYSAWKADHTKGNYPAVNPTVRGIALTGYVYARRSVGGIVGKIGQTSASNLADGTVGGIVENCVNFATVHNTDSKGCGGIVGAGWNKGLIKDCANFGNVYTSYRCPTGGIVGSNEVPLQNCYNMGKIDATQTRYAMAIGTNNGGASASTYALNCYWLDGTAPGGGYYDSKSVDLNKITDNYDGTTLTAKEFMQSANFVKLLNNGSGRDYRMPQAADAIKTYLTAAGYPDAPVPAVFTTDTATMTKIEKVADPTKTAYVETQKVDMTGLKICAYWSDGSIEELAAYQYTVTPAGALTLADTKITVSGVHNGQSFSFEIPITVEKRVVERIAVFAPNSTLLAKGEKADLTGMRVNAYYNDAPTKLVTLTAEDYTATVDENGLITVSYTYGGVTVTGTYQLTVLDTPAPVKDENGAYQLTSANDLLWFANQVTCGNNKANVTIAADVTMPDTFKGIGSASKPYMGTFDGAGHTITVNIDSSSTTALFAVVGDGTVLKNITVNGSVKGSTSAGTAGLVGQIGSGTLTIENCVNKASVSGVSNVGGLLGKSNGTANITGSVNEGKITSTSTSTAHTGGLVGYFYKGTIDSCTNSGVITASGTQIGGIVGTMYNSDGKLCRSGNSGAVTGAANVGGLAGYVNNATVTVTESYNTGAITATGKNANTGVGGIVGYCKGTVSDVYNLGTISNTDEQAGNFGVGGIIGHCMGYVKNLVTNAYNAGEIKATGAKAYAGSIVGRLSGTAVELANSYYLKNDASDEVKPVGDYNGNTLTVEGQPKTADELKALASTLGENFADDTPNYPVLKWQCHEHSLTAVAGAAPTCTKEGYEAYWKCETENCGKLFSDAGGLYEIAAPKAIAMVAHDLTAVASQAPTCTEAGHEAYWKCKDCGKLFSDADGKTEITAPKAIAALDHDFSVKNTDGKYLQSEANCQSAAVYVYSCSRCGAAGTATFTSGSHGPHSYDADNNCTVCGRHKQGSSGASGSTSGTTTGGTTETVRESAATGDNGVMLWVAAVPVTLAGVVLLTKKKREA